MARVNVTLDSVSHCEASRRASKLGISLAEYLRGLIVRDVSVDVSTIFDLGSSGGSNIAVNKDSMIAEAFAAAHDKIRTKPDRE